MPKTSVNCGLKEGSLCLGWRSRAEDQAGFQLYFLSFVNQASLVPFPRHRDIFMSEKTPILEPMNRRVSTAGTWRTSQRVYELGWVLERVSDSLLDYLPDLECNSCGLGRLLAEGGLLGEEHLPSALASTVSPRSGPHGLRWRASTVWCWEHQTWSREPKLCPRRWPGAGHPTSLWVSSAVHEGIGLNNLKVPFLL